MIEPRNAYTSRRPTLSQGRKAPPARRDGLARAAPPGSESGACGQGSPRNLGGLVVSTGDAAWAAAINSSPGPLARPAPAGANRAHGGTAKRRRTKRGGTGGEKSESADSTVEVGEPAPRGPGGGKRRIGSWAAVRKDAPVIEPDSRLNGSAAGSGEPPEMAVRGCARWRVAIPRLEEPDALCCEPDYVAKWPGAADPGGGRRRVRNIIRQPTGTRGRPSGRRRRAMPARPPGPGASHRRRTPAAPWPSSRDPPRRSGWSSRATRGRARRGSC